MQASLSDTSTTPPTLLGTTCMPYTVGAASDGLDLASLPSGIGAGGPSDPRGVALNAQLGLDGLRGATINWSNFLPNCSPSNPTAATCGPSAMTFANATDDYFRAAFLAQQDHVTYWLQASGGSGGSVPTALVTNGWWKADVTALVGYYAKVPAGCGQCAPVTMWEPWNEPNNTGWGDGSQYVSQVLAPFYQAVKSVLPRAASTVIGGSSLNVPIGWWQQVIAAGGLEDLDVASVHPYTGNNDSFEEDGMPAQVRQLQAMLGGKPLWFTEVGWWSDGDYNFLNQANVVARAMIWQKVLGVPVWNYFFDEGNWGNDGVSFSLIQASNTDDYVKPAALATMATASEIAHRPYLSMPATGIPQTYEASFGATAGGTDQVAALWSDGLDSTGSVKVTAPGGGSIPVTVTSEYGDATTVSATSGTAYSLPISDQVTYLTYPVGDTVTVGPTEDYGANLALWFDRSHRHRFVRQRVGRHHRAARRLRPGLELEQWGQRSGPDRHAARPAHGQPDRGRHPVGGQHGHRSPELHRLGRRAVGLDHRGHRGGPVPDPRVATGLRAGGRHRGQDRRLRGQLRRLLRRGCPPVVVAQPGRTRLRPCPPGLRRLGPA